MAQASTYTQALSEVICERLGEGEPLRQICRDDGLPSWRTVYRWLDERPDFAARFARARARGFDAIAEDCLSIADETSNDTVKSEQGERANTEWISRSKLRVETRLKLLAKWDPKRYGEKMTVAGDPDAPLAQAASPELMSALAKMSLEQLRVLASKPLKDDAVR